MSVLVIILLPLLLFAAGLAIDLANINAQKRYVQAQADLAALSAARDFVSAGHMRAAARATIGANARYRTLPIRDGDIELGRRLGRAGFEPAEIQDQIAGANAVRVTVRSRVRYILLGLFAPRRNLTVVRQAVAVVEPPRVSFALSNCLLNLRLLEPILRPIIPSQVDVLCSGRGIDTRIELLPTLTAMALRADLLTPGGEAMTYGEILDADLPVSDILAILLDTDVPPIPDQVQLAEFLHLGEGLRHMTTHSPVYGLQVQAEDLVLATAEVLGKRLLDLEARLDLGPLSQLQAAVRISEPRQIVLGAVPGDTAAQARTAQIRLEVEDINILNLFTLRLHVNLANARARLSEQGQTCSDDPLSVVAVFDPVDASLIEVDMAVQVHGLPGGQEALGFAADTQALREMRRVTFTRAEYEAGETHQIGPTSQFEQDNAVLALRRGVGDLLGETESKIRAAGGSCSGLLGCTVSLLKGTLDALAGTLVATTANVLNAIGAEGTMTNAILHDLLGLAIARAELELLDIRCGDTARLVR